MLIRVGVDSLNCMVGICQRALSVCLLPSQQVLGSTILKRVWANIARPVPFFQWIPMVTLASAAKLSVASAYLARLGCSSRWVPSEVDVALPSATHGRPSQVSGGASFLRGEKPTTRLSGLSTLPLLAPLLVVFPQSMRAETWFPVAILGAMTAGAAVTFIQSRFDEEAEAQRIVRAQRRGQGVTMRSASAPADSHASVTIPRNGNDNGQLNHESKRPTRPPRPERPRLEVTPTKGVVATAAAAEPEQSPRASGSGPVVNVGGQNRDGRLTPSTSVNSVDSDGGVKNTASKPKDEGAKAVAQGMPGQKKNGLAELHRALASADSQKTINQDMAVGSFVAQNAIV